jgi:hypothetical protein
LFSGGKGKKKKRDGKGKREENLHDANILTQLYALWHVFRGYGDKKAPDAHAPEADSYFWK